MISTSALSAQDNTKFKVGLDLGLIVGTDLGPLASIEPTHNFSDRSALGLVRGAVSTGRDLEAANELSLEGQGLGSFGNASEATSRQSTALGKSKQ